MMLPCVCVCVCVGFNAGSVVRECSIDPAMGAVVTYCLRHGTITKDHKIILQHTVVFFVIIDILRWS